MPHHAHSIDRRDEATGSNLYEHLAGVNDCPRPRDLRGRRQALARRWDYPAQRRPHYGRQTIEGGARRRAPAGRSAFW
jgi:hypothetical protein